MRRGGWNSYHHMCCSFLNLTVKAALKFVIIWRSYGQNQLGSVFLWLTVYIKGCRFLPVYRQLDDLDSLTQQVQVITDPYWKPKRTVTVTSPSHVWTNTWHISRYCQRFNVMAVTGRPSLSGGLCPPCLWRPPSHRLNVGQIFATVCQQISSRALSPCQRTILRQWRETVR